MTDSCGTANYKLYNGLKMRSFGFDALFDTCIGQSHDH